MLGQMKGMKKLESTKSNRFLAVILGGNRGAYGLAQAFYEAYDQQSVVISPYQTGPILHSRIVDHYLQASPMDIDQLLQTLDQIDRDYPEAEKLIFGSDDCYVELLVEHRHRFAEKWQVPYVERETYDQVTVKSSFYELCQQIGVSYPRTSILNSDNRRFSLGFPVIVKPAQTPDYQTLRFEGKQKVYICYDEQEASEKIALIYKNGYSGELIVQEYIQGDDQTLGIVTAYVAKKDRQLKLLSYSNVLVDDPTPSAIGNSLAGIVRREPEIEESVKKLLAASDFYGFATFDVKYDQARDEYVFFELNGRLGSSNYYVTASGNNVARYYVEDFIFNREIAESTTAEDILYTVLPKPLLLHMVAKGERNKVKHFYNQGKVTRFLHAPYERHPSRKAYLLASSLNYYKKLFFFPSLERKVMRKKQPQTFKHDLVQRMSDSPAENLAHKNNM